MRFLCRRSDDPEVLENSTVHGTEGPVAMFQMKIKYEDNTPKLNKLIASPICLALL